MHEAVKPLLHAGASQLISTKDFVAMTTVADDKLNINNINLSCVRLGQLLDNSAETPWCEYEHLKIKSPLCVASLQGNSKFVQMLLDYLDKKVALEQNCMENNNNNNNNNSNNNNNNNNNNNDINVDNEENIDFDDFEKKANYEDVIQASFELACLHGRKAVMNLLLPRRFPIKDKESSYSDVEDAINCRDRLLIECIRSKHVSIVESFFCKENEKYFPSSTPPNKGNFTF